MIEKHGAPRMQNAPRTFQAMPDVGEDLDRVCECEHRKSVHWDGWRKDFNLCHDANCNCQDFRPTAITRQLGATPQPIVSQ